MTDYNQSFLLLALAYCEIGMPVNECPTSSAMTMEGKI